MSEPDALTYCRCGAVLGVPESRHPTECLHRAGAQRLPADGGPAMSPAETVKADNLNLDDVLADGAIILRLSFQLDWIYAVVVKGGRLLRRRYRYGQTVHLSPSGVMA